MKQRQNIGTPSAAALQKAEQTNNTRTKTNIYSHYTGQPGTPAEYFVIVEAKVNSPHSTCPCWWPLTHSD